MGLSRYRSIKRVSFNGFESSFANRLLQRTDIYLLMSCRPAHVSDVVPDNRPINVIRAGLKHDLRHRQRLHNPEGFEMREIVKHQACDRKRAVILKP